MKIIGLLGGMSWESTAVYYRLINQEVSRRLGGLHSARILLNSVDFYQLELLQHRGEWDLVAASLAREAKRLERGGADLLLICTNTMHKVAEQVQAVVNIPLLHIADVTGAAVTARGCSTVALLGTRFTMEQDFYRGRLERGHGLRVLIPEGPERGLIHGVIYDELCHGEIRDGSRREFKRIIDGLIAAGAEGVILGCTEISLLIGAGDMVVPAFDTTLIHAQSAVDAVLQL